MSPPAKFSVLTNGGRNGADGDELEGVRERSGAGAGGARRANLKDAVPLLRISYRQAKRLSSALEWRGRRAWYTGASVRPRIGSRPVAERERILELLREQYGEAGARGGTAIRSHAGGGAAERGPWPGSALLDAARVDDGRGAVEPGEAHAAEDVSSGPARGLRGAGAARRELSRLVRGAGSVLGVGAA